MTLSVHNLRKFPIDGKRLWSSIHYRTARKSSSKQVIQVLKLRTNSFLVLQPESPFVVLSEPAMGMDYIFSIEYD